MTTTHTAHTPGPWVVVEESGNPGEAFVIESDTRTIAWTADTLPANAERDEDSFITSEDTANARLIAAAPALLEALEAMRRAYDADSARDANQSVAGSMADAAINAAKGISA